MERLRTSVPVAALIVLFCFPALAEMVEVAPGVSVTRKTYPVEPNEAPFFNFVVKNEKQRAIDDEFVTNILGVVPDRAQAARNASSRGWDYFKQGDLATAAKRFNQAYLLDPMDSLLYHGFAVVVFERFRDVDYADELFRMAARMNSPASPLSADHGYFLLVAGRPADAIPLLERGIHENPGWAVPRVNLALARLLTGDSKTACLLISDIAPDDETADQRYIALIRKRAHCR